MTAFWIDVRSLFYYFIFQFRNRRYERSAIVSSRNDICSRITQCNHTRFTFHCLKVSPPPLPTPPPSQALQKLASQYLKKEWPGVQSEEQKDYRYVSER